MTGGNACGAPAEETFGVEQPSDYQQTSGKSAPSPRNLVPLIDKGDAKGRGSAVEPARKQKATGESTPPPT